MEGTLGMCSIDCPPNSTDMQIRNFGLTRITMDQIHEIIDDVEDLKYNDAQFQMNNELQNRDAQTKKGVYSDDFSNAAQSDIFHAEWDARVNGIGKFAAPDRTALSTPLQVDQAASNVSLFGSLALLPGSEQVLLYQDDITWLHGLQSGQRSRRGMWDNRRNIRHISRIGPHTPTPRFGLRGGYEATFGQKSAPSIPMPCSKNPRPCSR